MRTISTELKFGVIYAVTSILWVIFEYLIGLHSSNIGLHFYLTWVFIIPAAIIFFLALKEKRAKLGGAITFKKAFISGLIMTGVIILLSPLVMPIYFKWINPNFFEDFKAYTVENGMKLQEAESYFTYSSYMMQGAIGNILFGVILSLIMALIVRKAPAQQRYR
jgi:hypothetical protein